ncbi:MAG: sulfotransferase domain-containing protein [Deltaproteobacteria bacterium]|nr:sulfotransferase domain-containing protein [Deltaproteobacteria bacterium]
MLITGYPKSGNSWFCYLVSYCMNVPYDNLGEPGKHPRNPEHKRMLSGNLAHKSYTAAHKWIIQNHDLKPYREAIGNREFTIYLVRDGRDVMVSYYYYLYKFMVEERKQAGLPGPAAMPQGVDDADMFSTFVASRAAEWRDHVAQGIAARPDMIIRYEDMQAAPRETLKAIFAKAGAQVEDSVIDEALAIFSFKTLSGRPKGQEDSASFFRKGIVGDWKNKFRERDREAFMAIAGDALVELGYETVRGEKPQASRDEPTAGLRRKISALEEENRRLIVEASALRTELKKAEARRDALLNSLSWKVTAPARAALGLFTRK